MVNDSPTSAATEMPVGDGFPNDLATSARAEVAPNWAKPAAAASAPVARIAGSCQPWSRNRPSGPAGGPPAEIGSGVGGGQNGRTTWNTSLGPGDVDLSDRLVAGDSMAEPHVAYLSSTPRPAGTLCLGLIEPGIPSVLGP